MINVKSAVSKARRAEPNYLLLRCVELDNGVLFFGKNKGESERTYGAIGLFVSATTPDVGFVPISFFVAHGGAEDKELDISRFQTPEETREAPH